MILLDIENAMILNIIRKKMIIPESGKPEVVDAQVADDDGIQYHLVTSGDDRSIINVNMKISFYSSIKSLDIQGYLKQVYGSDLQSPPSGYDVSIGFNVMEPSNEKKEEAALKIASFRKNLYGAILHHFFQAQAAGKSANKVLFAIRDGELICLEGKPDRVTVTYVFSFKDNDDVTIGRVFLNELKEGRKASQNAPQVLITYKDPPAELSGLSVPTGANVGYATFVLTANHIKEANREKTIIGVHNLLPYLKYHMKCSKAYLHSRMRAKTVEFIKVLNRARPETKSTEKKTFSGKTFTKT